MSSTPEGLIGRIIDGYRLEQRLGTGATGAVFLGRAASAPQAPVAIKILMVPWQLSDTERANFQARFRREAETLQRLRHPHILGILGFGETEGLAYIVLPYLEGGTLATRLANQGGPFPLNEVSYDLQQLAEALDYAHGQGIIHRDLKPGNVLLDREQKLYLADFSIVRLVDTARTKLTATGQVLGTLEYLAPEQVSGEDASSASDLYSLGVVIYELVTGRVPFQGKSFVELFKQHTQDVPPAPRLFRPDLPEPAEAALLQALAKQPAERFASAGAFAEAFAFGVQGHWAPGVRRPEGGGVPATATFFPDQTVATPSPTGTARFTTPPTVGVTPPGQVPGATAPVPANRPGQVAGPGTPNAAPPPRARGPAPVSSRPLPTGGSLPPPPSAVGGPPGAQAGMLAPPGTLGIVPGARGGRKKRWALALTALLLVIVATGVGAYLITQQLNGQGNTRATGTTATTTATATAVPTVTPRPPAGSIAEFLIPTAQALAGGIAAGPDGNLWFAEGAGKIGRITPQGAITEFPIPTAQSLPIGMAAGPDGNLWFAERGGNKIGRITTGGTITEFALPTTTSGPEALVAGLDGNLWFTEFDGNRIGRITTGGAITEFPVPTAQSNPCGIAVGPDNNLWFTEFGGDKIGRITTGAITEFAIPTVQSGPNIIVAGPDGNLWFTEYAGNNIGRLTTGGMITEFPIPTAQSNPGAIAVGPDGDLWFTERGGNKIGRITSGQ